MAIFNHLVQPNLTTVYTRTHTHTHTHNHTHKGSDSCHFHAVDPG